MTGKDGEHKMSEDFNWEQAEEEVARARATFEEYAPTAEEAEQRRRKNEENRLAALKERLGSAIYRLSKEAWGEGDAPTHGLEHEILIFLDEVFGSLNAMPPHEAADWLAGNFGAVERLHASTEREREHSLRVLVGLRGSANYTADLLEDNAPPASTEGPTDIPTTDYDDEIPWSDDDDDEEEEEFHKVATREIVAAYRQTAICIRDNLIARFREHAQRLGLQAAEHEPNPWRYGLNDSLGRFMGRIEVVLRGISPIEAQEWLQSNVEEFEGLRANTPREYDQAGHVLSGLSDRLFGMLYEIAREK
jgi:hypothetical protein